MWESLGGFADPRTFVAIANTTHFSRFTVINNPAREIALTFWLTHLSYRYDNSAADAGRDYDGAAASFDYNCRTCRDDPTSGRCASESVQWGVTADRRFDWRVCRAAGRRAACGARRVRAASEKEDAQDSNPRGVAAVLPHVAPYCYLRPLCAPHVSEELNTRAAEGSDGNRPSSRFLVLQSRI
jgi:hypothetical protein